MQIAVTQLAVWPDVTCVVGRHFDLTNSAGMCCHGPDDAAGLKSQHQYAPRLSKKDKG